MFIINSFPLKIDSHRFSSSKVPLGSSRKRGLGAASRDCRVRLSCCDRWCGLDYFCLDKYWDHLSGTQAECSMAKNYHTSSAYTFSSREGEERKVLTSKNRCNLPRMARHTDIRAIIRVEDLVQDSLTPDILINRSFRLCNRQTYTHKPRQIVHKP